MIGANASHRATEAAPQALFHGLGHSVGIAFAMSAAWDEAAACLSNRDSGGFDAAMRLFKKFQREAGTAQQAPASDQ